MRGRGVPYARTKHVGSERGRDLITWQASLYSDEFRHSSRTMRYSFFLSLCVLFHLALERTFHSCREFRAVVQLPICRYTARDYGSCWCCSSGESRFPLASFQLLTSYDEIRPLSILTAARAPRALSSERRRVVAD